MTDSDGTNSSLQVASLETVDFVVSVELIFGYPHEFMIQFEFSWGSPMLGERVATEITQNRNSDGFRECKDSAREGGDVAGRARRDAESRIGKSVVSEDNYLDIKKRKLIENKERKTGK